MFPESSGIAPLYVVYKESPRDKPGVVTGKGEDIFGIWLAGAGKDLGAPIPSQIADKLRGKEFSNFDAFRKAFWIEVSKDSVLMAQFNRTNQKKISSGKSPIAPKCEHYGKMIRYEIHHQHEISKGGAVFHVDNLAVVTPKHHKRIHFGKN